MNHVNEADVLARIVGIREGGKQIKFVPPTRMSHNEAPLRLLCSIRQFVTVNSPQITCNNTKNELILKRDEGNERDAARRTRSFHLSHIQKRLRWIYSVNLDIV